MSFLRPIFVRKMRFLLVLTVLCMGAAGCEPLFEAAGDCTPVYRMKFVYDMNMDHADAFASKVPSVELYAFEAGSGRLVRVFSESGAALAQEGYAMTLDLAPGDYDFVAWCGLADNEGQFTLPASVPTLADTRCTLARERGADGKATQNRNLHALFHGRSAQTLPEDNAEHTYTMPLVKNTNNISLSIQETGGKALDPDRFTIRMAVDNGSMAYDNSVLEDEAIEYLPYRKTSGSAAVGGSRADGGVRQDIILAELSTARLIAGHSPTLDIIDNRTGRTVYAVPLIKWALMLKSQQYAGMADQEYLDREDEFNIILYISEEDGITPGDPEYYLAVGVVINGWRMVINGDTELH